MNDILAGVVEKLQKGELPSKRDNLADCIVSLALVLISEYMNTDSPVSKEIGLLISAFNKSDPLLADMGLMEREAMWMVAGPIKKMLLAQKESNL